MNAQSKDPIDQSEMPLTSASESNSDLQNMSTSAETGNTYTESPEAAPPIDDSPREGTDAPTSAASEAVRQPKTSSKNARSAAKPKGKPRPKRRLTKAASAEKGATEEPEIPGDAANEASAQEGVPITAYLQFSQVGPGELSPSAATLPPKLASLFPGMAAVSAVLAATAAAIGHSVHLAANKDREDSSPALRVAIVGEERGLPQAIAPVLQAAYALEQEEVQSWGAEKQKVDLLGAADATRRRLYQQTLANVGLLGLAGLPDSLNPTIIPHSSVALPRPQFVLRDPGQKDVRRVLEAAESGVLLVDGCRMPTMANFGVNYDTLTANMLNTAASGRPLELADPRLAGCIRMRLVVASVIGTLATIDTFSIHKAGPAALAATVFVPPEEELKMAPSAGAVTTLTEILGWVRALAATGQDAESSLRLSVAARKTLEQAKAKLARASNEILPPLADYYAGVADLLTRIVVVLHVLDHAARKADRVLVEVSKEVVLRAVEFFERSVLPAARITLAVASVAPEVRDARRIISFAQQYSSVAFPLLARRDVIRILQRSMSVASVDQAIRRLVADGLLTASNPDMAKGGGHVFQVHPVVFEANYQLPDLVTDPRRPRQ